MKLVQVLLIHFVLNAKKVIINNLKINLAKISVQTDTLKMAYLENAQIVLKTFK